MWRFLWRPRWLLSHLLVLALAVAMVNLGFWQLRRLDERRELNELVAARLEDRAVPIDAVEDPANGRFRRVKVEGTVQGDLIVRNRTMDGAPGRWAVLIVELDGGSRALVARGFFREGDEPTRAFEAKLEGYLIPRSRLDRTARIDLDDAFDGDGVVQALVVQSDPPPREPFVAISPPDLGDGPHLGYAVQWFIFSAIAIGGYPLILRRVARERRDEATGDSDDLDRELGELLEAGG